MGENTNAAVNLEEVPTALANLGLRWVSGTTSMSILAEDERRVRLGVPLPPAMPSTLW